jgi:hypothetical protein
MEGVKGILHMITMGGKSNADPDFETDLRTVSHDVARHNT